jgi:hypothetical protein
VPVTEKAYGLKAFIASTMISLFGGVCFAFCATAVMMAAERSSGVDSIIRFCNPWAYLMWGLHPVGSNNAYGFLSLALPFVGYTWLWILGRSRDIRQNRICVFLLLLHLSGWGLAVLFSK